MTLFHTPITPPQQTIKQNTSNGTDAEILAASLITAALQGEVRWGSREEDNSKIDLIITFNHPWISSERLFALVQVKSGATYGEKTNKGFKLKKIAIEKAQRTSHAIFIIWINREDHTAYWAYIHPNSPITSRHYKKYNQVSPATRYDLVRYIMRHNNKNAGGRGIIIKEKTHPISQLRKQIKNSYKKMNIIHNPTFGEINCTRMAWRHMFRAGRNRKYKQRSAALIPYLDKIVSQPPSEQHTTAYQLSTREDFEHRTIEHLLKYNETKLYDRSKQELIKCSVIVRIIEEIRYPKNWARNAMLSQRVERKTVLKSAYIKL